MMSLAAVGSAAQGEYYQKDDYYFGRGEGGPATLAWGGTGAAMLGLSGPASHEDFRDVLEGRNPDPDGPPISLADQRERKAVAAEVAREAGPEKGLSSEPLDRGHPDADKVAGAGKSGEGEGKGERAEHKPGTDLTFSAPKSVSLAIMMGGDDRLLAAHETAVAAAMSYAQMNFAIARVRDREGHTEAIKTENLLWAQTTHSTSRHGDPNVHSHVVIANTTFVAEKGDWRAMDNKELYRNQILLGQIYQGELAKQAMTLGYDVRAHKRGTFELADFKAADLAVFSKSAARIAENLAQDPPSSEAAKEQVKLKNRPKKTDIPEHELAGRWDKEAAALGLDVGAMVEASRTSGPGIDRTPTRSGLVDGISAKIHGLGEQIVAVLGGRTDPYGYQKGEALGDRDPAARKVISHALQVAEVGSAVFTRSEVLSRALDVAAKGMTVDRLERELGRVVADGRVAPADVMITGAITTDRSLALEHEIIGRMKAGLGRSAAIYNLDEGLNRIKPDAVLAAGHDIEMNAGQTGAAALILTSTDRVIAVHGAAGAGKSTLFDVVGRAVRDTGLGIVGLTPTHTAKAALTKSAAIDSQTVSSFLLKHSALAEPGGRATREQMTEWRGKVLIVDEASMMSNADVGKLLAITDALHVRKTVLVGDYRQHGAVMAGAPFRHLINQEIPHAVIGEIVRQKDPELRGAVEHFSKGESGLGVRALGLNVAEVGLGRGDEDLAKAAVALWRQAREEGVTRPIITVSQKQRALVNGLIIDHQRATGEITPLGDDTSRLVAVQLQGPDRWRAANYEVGQILVFHSRFREAGISRGEHVTVVGSEQTDRSSLLTVQKASGGKATLNLRAMGRDAHEKFLTYEARAGGQLYVGAPQVWERSDKERELFAGQAFTPLGERDGKFAIRLASGAEVLMARDDPQLKFVGPGYAMTSNRSQSLTMADNPIGLLHSRNAHQAGAYVQASRGVNGFTLVTDDRSRLINALSRNDGMNLIAAEHVVPRMIEVPGHVLRPPGLDFDPLALKPEPDKSFVADRPLTSGRSL